MRDRECDYPTAAVVRTQHLNSRIRNASCQRSDADDIGTPIADVKRVQPGRTSQGDCHVQVAGWPAGCPFILSGCNTIEGAGKDMERGGEKIQDKAEKAKN